MGAQVSIGDFSVMTRLSRKALRHYHDLGLLVPAHIDPHSGYRFYDTRQADRAHIIRRFRYLGMAIPDVKTFPALGGDHPVARRSRARRLRQPADPECWHRIWFSPP
jgi:DNA-binding transcriptional MerR regulator